MLQTVQNIPNHLTKMDTLQAQVNHLSRVVDSLNIVSAANTIHTAYFHDIINSGVATFVGFLAIIAGLGSWIGWSALTRRFKRERNILRTDFAERLRRQNRIFDQLKSDFEKSNQSAETSIESMSYDLYRSVYSLMISNGRYESSILYGLQSMEIDRKRENYAIVLRKANTIITDLTNQQLRNTYLSNEIKSKIGDLLYNFQKDVNLTDPKFGVLDGIVRNAL